MTSDDLHRIERKIDNLLERTSALLAHFGLSHVDTRLDQVLQLCPTCREAVRWERGFDGNVQRLCGCKPPL